MYTREYKNTGKQISILGLGCMRLPKLDPEKPDIDEPKAFEMVDYAYNHGINYFDTAWPYHGEMSEEFVGRALKKYPRDSFYLATKMPVWLVNTPEDAERIFAKQLEKLQTDYFDFYLLHATNAERLEGWKKSGVYDVCRKLKEEGKIRHLGFSFHDKPEVLEQIVDQFEFDFAQIQFNYLDYELQDAKKQYEILESHHIPTVVMEPVRGGALADLCEESNAIFKAADPSASVASWALRYAMNPDNIMVVLSGMSNMEQLKDNIHTAETFRKLTPEEEAVIAKALDVFKKNNTVPCTACRYCQPCPMGVEIPRIFTACNQYRITKNANNFKSTYSEIPDEAQAHNCVACGACMEQCPQHIQIPDLMTEIANAYEALK